MNIEIFPTGTSGNEIREIFVIYRAHSCRFTIGDSRPNAEQKGGKLLATNKSFSSLFRYSTRPNLMYSSIIHFLGDGEETLEVANSTAGDERSDGKGCSQVESTAMAFTMAAEGCLLNMPRKIGFEILIFPRRFYRFSLPPLPPSPPPSPSFLLTSSRFPLYPRFSVSLDRSFTVVARKIPLARQKYIFYPGLFPPSLFSLSSSKYRCRHC